MNKLKYLLFILPFFFVSNVFAQDFNVSTSHITSPSSSGTGKYTGLEIYNSGTSNVYNIGTRYNGQLSRIIFNLIAGGYADANGFEKGHTYTLTMNMATDDWRNKFGSVSVKCEGSSGQELSNGRVTYISYRKIKFSFTAPSSTWCQFVYVDLKSTNISTTAFTGVSNWNLSSMVITDPYYSSGSGGSSGSSPTPTPTPTPLPNNQEIINNNNQNTQNIINNNNQNTQDIIENNNSNTDRMIEEIKNGSIVCGYNYKETFNYADLTTQGWLNYSDELTSSNSFRVSDYTPIFGGNTYRVTGASSIGTATYYSLNVYDQNKNFLFVANYANNSILNLSSYSGLLFFRINVNVNTGNNIMIVKDETGICVPSSYVQMKQNQDTTNAINDVNNSINNSNIDNGVGTSFFNNFTNQDFGLSQIITIPLSTIQSLTSKTCVPLQVPIPFTSSNINLPCMTEIYENKFPTIYNLWKIVSFGIVAYFIAIDIFHMVKGFKDPESDKVEVLDL